MIFSKFIITDKYWELYKIRVLSWSFVWDLCKWLGVFWMIIEPTSYFSDSFEKFITPRGQDILMLAIVITTIQRRPRLKFRYFIKDKDVSVTLEIGDLFKQTDRDIIIPTNQHFITDLSNDLVSEKSVQGQFTKTYYANHNHLDNDINQSLIDLPYIDLTEPFFGKTKLYPLGTVARFSVKKNDKKLFWTYFLALAKLNEHAVCSSNIGEFQQTLPLLWNFIKDRGELSDLALPILGSGFCRIDSSREDLFKEILLSFLAATRDSKFCKSLTFVIYYHDVQKMNIDIESLKDFTRFHTSTFTRESKNGGAHGQPI